MALVFSPPKARFVFDFRNGHDSISETITWYRVKLKHKLWLIEEIQKCDLYKSVSSFAVIVIKYAGTWLARTRFSVQYNIWNAIALSFNVSDNNEKKAATLSDVHLLAYTVTVFIVYCCRHLCWLYRMAGWTELFILLLMLSTEEEGHIQALQDGVNEIMKFSWLPGFPFFL